MRLPPPIKYINPRYSLYVGAMAPDGPAGSEGHFFDDEVAARGARGAARMPLYGVHDPRGVDGAGAGEVSNAPVVVGVSLLTSHSRFTPHSSLFASGS
jgi:hypothetical protein